MKSKLCIAVYVYGNYVDYIPAYVFSILHSYPEYYIKVFLPKSNSYQNNLLLDRLRSEGYSRFEIVENFKISNHADGQKHARWLIPRKEFEEFKYVYIGDVDFIILPESPSILEHHSLQMIKAKVPYSNRVRPNSSKLTGLHFYEVERYYNSMDDIIREASINPIIPYKNINKNGWNERFLYEIIKRGIGVPPQYDWMKRPHHGLHLGLLRINNKKGINSYKTKYPGNYEIFRDPMYDFLEKNSGKRVSKMLTKARLIMTQ